MRKLIRQIIHFMNKGIPLILWCMCNKNWIWKDLTVFLWSEGKDLATSFDAKFIETSAGAILIITMVTYNYVKLLWTMMNNHPGLKHNVDELLVGVLKQILLRQVSFSFGSIMIHLQPNLIHPISPPSESTPVKSTSEQILSIQIDLQTNQIQPNPTPNPLQPNPF